MSYLGSPQPELSPTKVDVLLVGGCVVRGVSFHLDTEDERLDHWGAATGALVRREGAMVSYSALGRRVLVPRLGRK